MPSCLEPKKQNSTLNMANNVNSFCEEKKTPFSEFSEEFR